MLELGPLAPARCGGHGISVQMDGASPVRMRTPQMHAPWGPSKFGSLDLLAPPSVVEYMKALDAEVCDRLVQHSPQLFGEQLDSVQALYVSHLVTTSKGEALRIKIMDSTPLFGPDGEPALSMPKAPFDLRAILSFKDLWVRDRRVGLLLKIEQAKWYAAAEQGCELLSDDEDILLTDDEDIS